MSTLMDASNQWATRPADERFVSLLDMRAELRTLRVNSRATVLSNRSLHAAPVESSEGGPARGLSIVGPSGAAVIPTHWSFGQLAQRFGAAHPSR